VTQQDSQANIQIARSTMQENVQMTALTKASVDIANQTKALGIATLKDSNAMKNIAILTTIFLPGTYIAVSIWIL
jgi:3D (Asp-Asp-Asp) domain-containing protein